MSNNSNQYSKQLESLFSDITVPTPDPAPPAPGSASNGGAVKSPEAPKLTDLPKLATVPVITEIPSAEAAPRNGKGDGLGVAPGHAVSSDFERLFEMSPQMLCIVEPDGWFRQVNPACEAALGWNSTELSRRLFFELVHPEDVAAIAVEFQKLAKGAKKIQFGCRYRHKSGAYHQLRWQLQSGSDKALYAIAHNALADNNVEQVLREKEERLSEAQRIAKLGWWTFEVSTGLVNWDEQTASLLDLPSDTPPTLEALLLTVHLDDQQRIREHFQHTLASTVTTDAVEYRAVARGGEIRHLYAISRILRAENGAPVKIVGTVQDTTERKQAEAQLRETEERTRRSLVANVPGVIYRRAADRDWTEYFISEAVAELSGYPASDFVLNKERTFVSLIHAEDRAAVEAATHTAIAKHQPFKLEYRLLHAHGGVRWVSDMGRAVYDQAGGAMWLDGCMMDITASKKAEQLLAKQALELKTVSKVSIQAAQSLAVEALLQNAVDLTRVNFDFYHAHIYLLNETGDQLVLGAGAGEVGRQMAAQGWAIPLDREHSLVARAARTRQGVIINDVRSEPDFMPNPLLPDTRSELAVPVLVGEQLLGVLDVQADTIDRFEAEDVQIQTTLAAQIAVALQNSRQYERLAQLKGMAAAPEADLAKRGQEAEAVTPPTAEQDDSARFLDSVIESLPTMLFVKDAKELRFVRWNKAGADLLGFKREDLLGKNDYDFFPKEEADFFTSKDREVLAGGEMVEIPEEPIQTAYGTTRILHTRKVPILGADGKPKYLLGISEDITERKQSEEALAKRAAELAEATRFLDSVVENLPTMLFVKDAAELRFIRWNKAGEDLIGFKREDLLGKNDHDFFPKEEADFFTTKDRDVLNGGQLVDIPEEPIQTAYGTTRILHTRKIPILDAEGKPHFLLGISEDITERKRIENAILHRDKELSAFNRVVMAATSTLDLHAILQQTTQELVPLLNVRNSRIALLDPSRQRLTVIADSNANPDEPSAIGVVIAVENNPSTLQVLETKGPVVSNNIQTSPFTASLPELTPTERARCLMMVPLLSHGEVIGTVGLDSTEPDRQFTDEEVALVATFAGQLVGAIENIRLFEDAQRRANEMATVAQVGAAVSATRQLDTLLQSVVDLTKSSFNLYHVHVYLLNDLEDTLVLASGAGEIGRTMAARGWSIPLNREQSLVARAARTRQGVLVNDVTVEPGFLPNPLLPDTCSELAVPMIIGDKVIGVLDVQADVQNRFDDQDVKVKTALANQVAIAVDNARSFERSEKILQELSKLTRQLTREGWSEYFETSTRLGFTYDLARIRPLDTEAWADSAATRDGAALDDTGKPVIVQPLAVRGETIGHLVFEDPEQADQETREIIATIAERLSGHIENLRLTEQEQRRAAQLAKLSQVQSALSLATTEAEILSTVTLAVTKLDWLALHYIETGEGDHPLTMNTIAVWKDGAIQPEDLTIGQRYPVTLFATARLWLQNPDHLLYIADIQNDPRATEDLRASARRVGYAAMCTIPLRSGGRWQGTVNLSWPQANPLTVDEQFILEQIMEPLASAVASRRSYLAEQTARRENERRAVELEAVAKLSTAASTILDSQDLLQAVVDLTKERFDLYHAHIYLLDTTAQTLVLTAGAGEIGYRMVSEGRSIPLDLEHSIVATAARTRQPVVISDVHESPTFLPNSYLPDTRAEMAVPLVVGDRLLGVFDVQSDEAGRFSTDEAKVQVTLASQVAVALQNATLFAEQTATVTRLRELDQLKSAFLANMSHELRTPLNSILGFTEVLIEGIDGPLTDRMENDLKVVYKNGQHLLNLINDILDMAKIEAGKMRLSPEWFNVQEVLEEVIETATPLANARSLNLQLLTPLNTVLGLEADRVRVRQVMLNLVNNALKFTESGSVVVDAVKGDAVIRIIVRDTGVGIPVNQLESIFQEFHQVDSTTTRKAGGTGLGLPISRRLIGLHGGRLWAESSGVSGEGSTFIVELPLESRYNRPD